MPRSFRGALGERAGAHAGERAGVAVVASLALFVGAALAGGGTGRVAADDGPLPRVASLDAGGTALASAVRGSRFVPLAFPMQSQPRCVVLANFGESRSGGRVHQGVDILATLDQEVYAVVAGSLTDQVINGESGSSLSGNYWTLTAPEGDRYTFMHLSRFAEGLEVGDDVVAGQLIGYVGDTGNPGAGNYHLHFEYRPAGRSNVDPMTILRPILPLNCSVIY